MADRRRHDGDHQGCRLTARRSLREYGWGTQPITSFYDPHLHLLIDDDEVDASWHVTRTIARPEARTVEPILRPDRPWEGEAAGLWASVLHDEDRGRYRMWYRSFHDQRPDNDRNFLNYAESANGLDWEKPNLDLIEYEGSTANNIIYRPNKMAGIRGFESHGVIVDEEGAPERRYKLVAYHGFEERSQNGLFGLFSPDGLSWSVTDSPLLPLAGDRHAALKDEATGEYVVYTRAGRYRRTVPPGELDDATAPLPYKRIIARTTSTDFLHWSEFETVLRNDDFDQAGTQFYSISPIRYGNRYVAFVDIYDTEVERIWVTLASSLDGVHWNRPLRSQRLLDLGAEGRWDDSWVNVTNNPPAAEGRNLRFWYMGRSQAHGLPYRTGAMGSFLIGRDRFAGLAAGRDTGTVITAPVEVGARRLFVNANVRNGRLRIAIAGADGGPLPGLALADCTPAHGDRIDHEISWSGGDLAALVGSQVRLRFEITYGTVFAFRFGTQPRVAEEG
jgi:hypothetical protein